LLRGHQCGIEDERLIYVRRRYRDGDRCVVLEDADARAGGARGKGVVCYEVEYAYGKEQREEEVENLVRVGGAECEL
jgi:hypothetical protein